MEIDNRPDEKFGPGFIGTCSVSNRYPCSLPKEAASWPLKWGEDRGTPGGQAGGATEVV